MSKLTTQDRLNIVALAKSGMSQNEIAQMYNISLNTVYTVISKAKCGSDLKGTSSKRRLSKQEVDSLINDLKTRKETGVTIVQLAVKYGVCEHTIYHYIEKHNLQKEHPHKLSDEQKQSIYEQYNEGTNAAELSKKFGVSVTVIYNSINTLKKSNEQIAGTVKIITEQFNSELSNAIDSTFIENIDRSLLSETTIKYLDDIEDRKKKLFEMYKEYSIELINYAENVNAVSKLVKTEMEGKYKYLQSKFERMMS